MRTLVFKTEHDAIVAFTALCQSDVALGVSFADNDREREVSSITSTEYGTEVTITDDEDGVCHIPFSDLDSDKCTATFYIM